jgi:hypothetical protein
MHGFSTARRPWSELSDKSLAPPADWPGTLGRRALAVGRGRDYFFGRLTGIATSAGRTAFHSSNVSVTFASPAPTEGSTRTGLRQYSPQASSRRTFVMTGWPPAGPTGNSITAFGQAPFG